jgi:hypothetical protein
MGHFAHDVAMLCRTAVYEEFGLPDDEALTGHWDHIVFDVHTAQMHDLPGLATLRSLRLLQPQEDPGTGSKFQVIDRIQRQTGRANLLLTATAREIRDHLDAVRDRNVFSIAQCESREDTADLMDWLRSQPRPL